MSLAPEVYDVILDDKGYLVAYESEEPYKKVGPNTIVEQQDLDVEEISENKLDGLFWSSQRSWFNGGFQWRLDGPQSDDEKFLVSKNLDNSERGLLALSRRFEEHVDAPATTSTQTEGYAYSQPDYFIWAAPDAVTTTTIELLTVQAWNDTTPAERSTGFGDAHEVQGLTSDGQYIYCSNATGGSAAIRRGLLSQTTTTLSAWHTRGLRDIAFVKESIYGWTTAGGTLSIWQVSTGTTPTETEIKAYGEGWGVRSVNTAQDVFAEIGTHVAWIANAAGDGYVWLYNGSDPPFIGARFPNIEAIGIVSYANDLLFVLGRRRATTNDSGAYDAPEAYDTAGTYDGDGLGGSPLSELVWIQVEVNADGGSNWDILHVFDALPQPKFEIRNREVYFPVSVPRTRLVGLTLDDGIGDSSYGNGIASFNVATKGMTINRYWGLHTDDVLTGVMWGDTGFTNPCIGFLGGALGFSGEHGGTRYENVNAYAPMGELVSSEIDLNIDSAKMFLVGEAGFDDLEPGYTVTLQFWPEAIHDDDPVWTTIGTATSGQNIRERIEEGGVPGVSAVHAHYRIQLSTTVPGESPQVHKAGLGLEPVVRPRFDHILTVKAFDQMTNRNDVPWPGDRPPETIQSELEALRAAQSVVDFREPRFGKEPAPAVKVQVRHVETLKRHEPSGGAANLITVKLRELPT